MVLTKKEIDKIKNEVLELFGIEASKRYSRGKSYCLPLYQMTDGTYYKHKKNMLISNKIFKSKHKLDCNFILDEYANNEWLPLIEDMSKEEIIEYCEKHSL